MNQKSLYNIIGCMFFQQMNGINVMIYCIIDIFNSTGSHLNPHICSIMVSVVKVKLWNECV